jgi:two-component system invasion response regulator UvrY
MNQTCIIVDDQVSLRSLLIEWLGTAFQDIKFLGAASGEEALVLVRSNIPVAVIMDVGLPGISGIEATRQIKQSLPETCVIIHTIHEDLAYREDAESAGADFYITKSRTQADLIPVLLEVFSRSADKEVQAGAR